MDKSNKITDENIITNQHVDNDNNSFETVENHNASEKNDNEKSLIEKNEGEVKKKLDTVSFLSLFKYADGFDYLLIFFATIASFGNGLAQPASFIIFGKVIQDFIKFAQNTDNSFNILDSMKKLAIFYCILAAAMFVCSFFQAAFWSLSAARQVHKIRIKFYKSILQQDVGWFDVNDPGTLTTRLSDDLVKIQSGIGDKVGMILQATAMFFGGFGVGFFYSWKLTLVIMAASPVLMICGAITGKAMGSLTVREQSAYADAGSIAEEVISSIRTVVAFGGEQEEIKRYNEKLSGAQKAGIKKSALVGASIGLFHICIFGCYGLAFWYGAKLVSSGEISPGDLMTVFFCVMVGATSIGQGAPNFEAIASAKGAAYVVFQICVREPAINCLSDEGKIMETTSGEILLSNVQFSYPSRPEIPIFDGLDLVIKPGSTVALVGESGSGKSTIVKLIQRFYDVVDGSIKLDGVNIKEFNLKSLRSNIGVVSQEPVLFDMSIAENIRLGAINDASDLDVVNAAKCANAHEFISSLPQGYHTRVGEMGAQLSGGQKQRIAIARALIRNPKVLLFDEATSALDSESEKIVQEALDKVRQGRTTIVVAHRLSTIKNVDVIIVVKDGKVAESGTHKELLSNKGLYYQLVLLQRALEADDLNTLDDTCEEKNEDGFIEYLPVDSNIQELEKKEVIKVQKQVSRSLSVVEKSTEFGKQKEKTGQEKTEPAPFSRVIKLNASEWPYLLFGTIFALIVGAFPVLFALIISELINVFSKPPDVIRKESVKWSLYFLGLGVVDCIGLFFSSFLFGIAGEILTRRLRKEAFTAILRQDISFFDDPMNSTGALTARLNSDASAVKGATSSRLNILTQSIFMGVTSLAVSFYFSWKLTLLLLAFAPILLIAGAAHMKIFSNFALEQGKHLVDACASAQEAIMNIRTVASLGKEVYFIDDFVKKLSGPFRKSVYNSLAFGVSFGLSGSIMMLANAAAFTLGGKLVQDHELEFSNMFKVVFAVVFGALIAGQISSMAPNYMEAKISAARMFKLLDKIPMIDSFSSCGKILDSAKGEVVFDNVCFSYPSRPDANVLNNFSFKIEFGKKVALVGSSGCGKSTCISLLERFYDPQNGVIKFDDVDIKDLNMKWMRSCLGLVSQEPVLFARSIKENISYGLENDVSMEDIEQAAKKANIHGFVMSLPKGYDTEVGDKGTLISGGQKQRIAIARALIRNPKIMLLDEATSALDSESEKIVQEALDAAMENRSSIVIAHRLSTIQNADVIIVMQNGRIVEVGTHSDLIVRRGVYYQLNQAQL
ncbi:ATP-dependent translocase ABCB1 isoform X1 [Hydra vulgaris]|uniref:ATP-dependent translocase ABCB1 isoform X1 n=2 Tax=Hydra vulgaris TaxID=6087 RepID=UPI001F5E9F63|nr:ATP-dependent translocase ABCB1 isoform X1 [Hydra vulgaris]